MVSCLQGHEQIVKLLVEKHDANVRCASVSIDHNQFTGEQLVSPSSELQLVLFVIGDSDLFLDKFVQLYREKALPLVPLQQNSVCVCASSPLPQLVLTLRAGSREARSPPSAPECEWNAEALRTR